MPNRNTLPPLVRGALEAAFEELGALEPRVDDRGRVFELTPAGEKQLRDPAFLIEIAVIADLVLEALTGQRSSLGREVIERLSGESGGRFKSLYEQRRGAHGSASPEMLRDALRRARRIVAGTGGNRNSAAR